MLFNVVDSTTVAAIAGQICTEYAGDDANWPFWWPASRISLRPPSGGTLWPSSRHALRRLMDKYGLRKPKA